MTEEIKHIEEQPKDNCDECRNKDCLQCPDIPELKKKQLLEEMRNLVREEYRELIERLEIDRDTYKHEVEVMKKNCKHNID